MLDTVIGDCSSGSEARVRAVTVKFTEGGWSKLAVVHWKLQKSMSTSELVKLVVDPPVISWDRISSLPELRLQFIVALSPSSSE